MIVEKQGGRGSLVDEHAAKDRFPVGMRVLAVDDDQTCLKVLEKMLMQCRYHVTTTTQSTKALEMLRENKDNFDLVISDVNMPDMDGFKLLELVGLEMDLPVIMVTAHKEPNLVKKGVLHGACDYLLKPVRMEELQIIWRHVFRRQIDIKDQNNASIEEKACNMAGEGSQGIASENNADQDKKLGKRRKEQAEEEEEDDDEDEQENEDPSTQKKPRLVWTNELHRKFIAAVTQLGLEKAVPKKILELINVEGITRENVASHLQKYRLGLRKHAQQATMVTALGGSDHFLQMASQDRCASGSGRFSSTTLPSYASSGIFSRLNSPSGLNLRGMSSSALVQPDQPQNISGSIKALGNIHSSVFVANQSSNLFQGISTSVELNQLQQSNYTTGIRQLSPIDNSSICTVSSVYPKSRAAIGNGNQSLPGFSSNHLLLHGNCPPTHNSVAFRNHSSVGAASVSTDSFDTGIYGASNLLDYNRWNESKQTAAQLSRFPANILPLGQAFSNGQLPQTSLKFSSSTSHIGNIPVDFSTNNAIVPLEESRGGLQCQEGLIGNIVQASCYPPQQSWEQHKQVYNQNTNPTFNSLVSSNGDSSSLGHTSNQNNAIGTKRVDAPLAGQLNEATPSINRCSEPEKFHSDARVKPNDACILQRMESEEGVIPSDFESLDDIICDMVKPEQNGMLFMNAEMVFDADPIGSSI